MRRAVLGGLAALMLFAGPAWSAEPSAHARELAGRYVRAVKLVETIDRAIATMTPVMLDAAVKSADLSPGDEQRFRKAANEAAQEAMADYSRKAVAELEAVAAEVFTEEELAQSVAFYESPVGRSIVAKQPELNARFTPRLQPLVDEVKRTMMLRMMQKLCPGGVCEAPAAPQKHGA